MDYCLIIVVIVAYLYVAVGTSIKTITKYF